AEPSDAVARPVRPASARGGHTPEGRMMPAPILLHPSIDLHVEGRISHSDAERQRRTAEELLRRLDTRPGQILADEVGMGKTFVALAVAASVVLASRRKGQVVVMAPPSVLGKGERDFHTFTE